MGAATSGLLAEFFLQHLEQLHTPYLSDKHKIIKYFRYVDDILVIYDTNHTDAQNILTDFNTIHPTLGSSQWNARETTRKTSLTSPSIGPLQTGDLPYTGNLDSLALSFHTPPTTPPNTHTPQ